jgi:hypothetical protein
MLVTPCIACVGLDGMWKGPLMHQDYPRVYSWI